MIDITPKSNEKNNQIASKEYETKLIEKNFIIKIILYSTNINFIAQVKTLYHPFIIKIIII